MYEPKENTTSSEEMEAEAVQEMAPEREEASCSPSESPANATEEGFDDGKVPAANTPEGAGDPADPASALEAARADLAILREEIALLREQFGKAREQSARAEAERAEFRELYPEADLSALPDDVLEQVKNGTPLCAAYALFERRRLRIEEKAAAQSIENKKRSFGRIERERNGYFSADEVRAMSAAEVRKNYHAILHSMQKWQ